MSAPTHGNYQTLVQNDAKTMLALRQGNCWPGSNPKPLDMNEDVVVAGAPNEEEGNLQPEDPADEEVDDIAQGGEAPAKFKCEICGKGFTLPARLNRHFKTHTGERPWICEVCGKGFAVKENLSVHLRVHTKERPYSCDVCGRAFEHSGKLHRHRRIHTGERPHRCPTCGKDFIQSGQLVIHQRSHTGEKPFVCRICEKGFTCSKQLKVHQRTHTGEKPYTCSVCHKSFGYNHVLKFHTMSHYGEKYYKCRKCSESFSSREALKQHLKGCRMNPGPSVSRDASNRTTPVSSEKSSPDISDGTPDRRSANLLHPSGSRVLAVSPGGSGVQAPGLGKDSGLRIVSPSGSGLGIFSATGSSVRIVSPGIVPEIIVTGPSTASSDYEMICALSVSNRLSVIESAPRTPSPRAPHGSRTPSPRAPHGSGTTSPRAPHGSRTPSPRASLGFEIRAVNYEKAIYHSDVVLSTQAHNGGSRSVIRSRSLNDSATATQTLAPGGSLSPDIHRSFDRLSVINHPQRFEIEVTSSVPDSHGESSSPSSFLNVNGHRSTNTDTESAIQTLAPGGSLSPDIHRSFDRLSVINHPKRFETEVTSSVPDSRGESLSPSSFLNVNGHRPVSDTKSVPLRKRSFSDFLYDSSGGSSWGSESADSASIGQISRERSPDLIRVRAQSVIMFAEKSKDNNESQH